MDINKLTLAITKALAYTENGGKPGESKAGGSGELKSMFQFLPETWKSDAKAITGDENLPVTPENEIKVVTGKVNQWVQEKKAEGKDDATIAKEIGSEWNSGNPNAYKENLKGVNKEGVAYDTPKYADKVANYTKEFLGDKSLDEIASSIGNQPDASDEQTGNDQQYQQALKSHNDAMNNLVAIAKQAKANSAAPLSAGAPLPQNNNVPGMIPPSVPNPGLIG